MPAKSSRKLQQYAAAAAVDVPDMAQAGGKDASKLDEALKAGGITLLV